MLANVGLIYQNSQQIEHSKKIQDVAERVKVSTLDIIRDLHLLDIGVRGYGLSRNPAFLSSVDSARKSRELIFKNLSEALQQQNYTNIDQLDQLHEAVRGYFEVADSMLNLIDSGRQQEFLTMLNEDRGLNVWLSYKAFSHDVNEFENTLATDAQVNYERALRNSYLLQALLFLLAVPSLVYMAYFSSRAFFVMDDLRKSEEERNKILAAQNLFLDEQVRIKTKDIQTQNAEIMTQNEEIRARNDKMVLQQQLLQHAKQTIEDQSRVIEAKNLELEAEVLRQTNDLREANRELIQQNSSLEQFTYIISHNLRAPLARLKGLANILESADGVDEKEKIYRLMINSSQELDDVISDLNTTLSIQRLTTHVRTDVNLEQVVKKVLSTLRDDISRIHAQITLRLPNEDIQSLPPYIESIFYNLISNAIKYRDPDRGLQLNISGHREASSMIVYVQDNGLGIDLAKYKNSLFNLYKRFHLHVEGKGLGLYLVKTQVEALGGTIDVESVVNSGTKFTISFKL